EKGETPQEAATRELFEETGIKINKEDLNYIGTFKYNLSKDIALNLCKVNKMPKILDLKCTSLFTSKDGKQYPEIISYKYVYIGSISSYLRKNMMKAIKNSKIVDLARGEDNYE
ncbi:MAG: NUDIX domain-containing protein, partial [Spirochaetia bacterium]|nr:NUDIX domain-containing protein [Spirochaetia bacterium]